MICLVLGHYWRSHYGSGRRIRGNQFAGGSLVCARCGKRRG